MHDRMARQSTGHAVGYHSRAIDRLRFRSPSTLNSPNSRSFQMFLSCLNYPKILMVPMVRADQKIPRAQPGQEVRRVRVLRTVPVLEPQRCSAVCSAPDSDY